MKKQYTITLWNNLQLKTTELVLQTETAKEAIKIAMEFAEQHNLSVPMLNDLPIVIEYSSNGNDRLITITDI